LTAPRPLILATRNRGKAREFGRLLRSAFLPEPLPDGVALPEETGGTFASNARLKAEVVFRALGGDRPVLADDSGLEVTALAGRPGVLSARFAGAEASDEENVGKLLAEMEGRDERAARFVCALCLALPAAGEGRRSAPRLVEVEGALQGTITLEPRGTEGFGYDPVFQPSGWEETLSEADPADKDRVSHRGAAARALLTRLQEGR
jgi:XTP/dITP diphosphohydrolase